MPMDVEFCATCGCSEFDHLIRFAGGECEPDCDEDCDGEHDEVVNCGCGRCDDCQWMDEPTAVVCVCGCDEDDHVDDVCEECGDCVRYEEAGLAVDRLRAELARRGGTRPAPAAPGLSSSTLRLDWLDTPVEVVGALVVDDDNGVRRVSGMPDTHAEVLVFFAVTPDGLEVAVSRDELTS